MIRKLIAAIAICLLLTGCTKTDDFAGQINLAIQKACTEAVPDNENNNCVKEYYTYYLDKNIGKSDGDAISNQFIINGNVSSLALDISTIALNQIEANSDKYSLRDIGTLDDVIYTKTGRFFNTSNSMIPYKISISDIENNNYLVIIQTTQFMFISRITNGNCDNTIHDMLVLLRTCKVNEKQVILDYSSDSITQKKYNVITIFDEVIPETGYIGDYMDQWKDDKNFVTIEKDTSILEPVVDEYDETIDEEDGDTDNENNPNRQEDEDNINE